MSPRSLVASQTLLTRAQLALGMSQRRLGDLIGVSRRTIIRWTGSSAHLTPTQRKALVVALHPVDAGLALEIAKAAGETLEGLGVVTKPTVDEPKATLVKE